MDEQQINLLKPPPRRCPASEQWQNHPFSPPAKNKTNRVIFFILAMAILGGLIFRNYTIAKWPSNPAAYDPVTLKPKRAGFLHTVRNFIFNSDNVISGQQEDRINILLLGIGGSGHDGPYLSDTNIILSIKPSKNLAAMISVPRDLAIKINGHGLRKINNANAFGEAEQANNGGEYARKIFEEAFNLNIPYYARVDFAAFKELVNAMGGLTINVERSFTDAAYPSTNNSFQTVSFEAGLQEMDGERALIFTRSRHGSNGEGSDFARAKRQQLALAAFKQKLLSAGTYLNPVTMQKIMASLSQHILTNMDFGQIMYLSALTKKINGDNVKMLILDDSQTGFLKSIISEDGAYLLVPKTGNYSEINFAINNIFEDAGTTTARVPEQNQRVSATIVPSAKIEIQNGTWRAGLAAIKKQELEKDGLLISSVGNSAKRPIAATAIYIINPNTSGAIITSLAKKLRASSTTTTLPEWLLSAYNAFSSSSDIVVVLGEDALQ
jgi:polyisoprenyl-teichoic acid--peptidoglycan teichoic acid transferase